MRRKDREVKEIQKILEIIDKAKILHLGLFDGNYPYIVPMHYGYEYQDGSLTFYVHSANEGHKLDLIRENSNVCVELETNIELVTAEVACNYGSTYSSVMGKGVARIIEDEQEKKKGLNLLMKNQTGKEFEFNGNMVKTVTVVKIIIEDFTGKEKTVPVKK